MSDNRFNGTNDDYNDYDSFDSYNDDSFDNFKYDSYDDDDNYSLTRDDDMPLTSARSEDAPQGGYERPLDRSEDRNRPPSRRETIKQVAKEQQSGVPRKPGVTPPDSRMITRDRDNQYRGRRLSGSDNPNGRRPRSSSDSVEGRRAANKASKKSMFAAFYIVLLLIAVGVCLTVLVVVLENMDGVIDNIPVIGTSPNPTPSPTPPAAPLVRADMRSQTSLITGINPFGEARTLTLLDTSTRRTHEFVVPDETRLADRLNRSITFAELRVGNIVDISYDARSLEIATIRESIHAWEFRSRTNVLVNIEESQITLGNEVWSFNSQTLVRHRGEPFPISQVRAIDSVTLLGQGDTVWLVQVDAAHGFLRINNADIIANGSVMIGTNLVFALDDIETDIELHEGTHRVIVEGENIETFIEDITIYAGQVTHLNMGDAQLRAALLHIAVSPEDAQIFVNGELHDNIAPAQVEFGEVLVRVERYGFLPQEQRLYITVPVSGMSFELEEIINENTLVIFTIPTNAEIFIDNVFVGFSTLTHSVQPGTFSIVARLPGYSSPPITVVVTGRETEDIFTHILLMPTTDDPLANLPPIDVDPIPPEYTSPFPTIPPANEPTPTPFNPFATPTPFNPFATPTPPEDEDPPDADNTHWWLQPPT